MKLLSKTALLFIFVNIGLISSQTKIKFGVDCTITDRVFQDIVKDTSNDFKTLFEEYSINYLRFPGGSPVRYFFWNNPGLSSKAQKQLGEYYQYRGLNNAVKKMERDHIIPNNIYKDYLQFCNRSDVTPIVQLNTTYYNVGTSVFPLESFYKYNKRQKLNIDRWEIIKSNLITQLDYTHNLTDIVYWEIGNEEYFIYEAEDYGNIVLKYIEIIKSKYPDDQVIVEMANSYWGGAYKNRWNKNFIGYLYANNALNKIDFFAPHFYNNPKEIPVTEKEIGIKIRETDAQKYENKMIEYFPKTYSPNFFYTEFQVFRKPAQNQHFNTQLHAIEMFYFMMRFAGSKNLYGVIHHCFTSNACGLFFDDIYLKRYPYMKDESENSTLFAYTSPQVNAIKLFYETCGDSILEFHADKNYLTLFSEDSNGKYLQILNFSSRDININLLNLIPIGQEIKLGTKYRFSELNSHDGNIKSEVIIKDGKIFGDILLSAYSLLIFCL